MKFLIIFLIITLTTTTAYGQSCSNYGEPCSHSLDCCANGGAPYCRYGHCTKWGDHPDEMTDYDPCSLVRCPGPCYLQAEPNCSTCPAWAKCAIVPRN